MDALLLAKKEQGVSKHCHITHLNSPSVFELDNGQIGCTLLVQGVPFDTATNEDLNRYKSAKHHAITMIGEEFSIVEHTLRRKMDIHLDGEFPEPFTRAVNKKYHAQFKNTNLYANELYITLLYKGVDSGKFNKALNLLRKVSNKAIKNARENHRAASMEKLSKAVAQFNASMSSFTPRILGENDAALGYSEVLTFYGMLVNGLERCQFAPPVFASPQGKGLTGALAASQRYPCGNIANYLPSKRTFFGRYIELQGANGVSRFAVMLSLKRYGTQTLSIMLDKLLHLDGEFIYTNSFAVEPTDSGHKKIAKQLIRMENSGSPAVSEMQQLSICNDDLASDRLTIGYHHNTVMLLADSTKALDVLINKAVKIYSDVGIVAVAETIGMEAAYWAQLPGNQKYIVRASLITSQNFVDFCPNHNYRTGYRDKNHLGAAVTLIETPSKTPMFFNYHAKGSGDKNDLTPGHTTIIGGNGSGKTVFMCFMDSQMSRYGGRSFFFDRDRGMEIYVRACGGVYSIISPEHPEEVQFNPFCLDDTKSNRAFLKQWLAQLIKEPAEEELPSAIDEAVASCIDYAYDSLSKEHRNLTTATQLLPIDFPRWERLRKWLRGTEVRGEGEWGYLFDNDSDALDVNATKLGFDFTDLMDQPKSVMTSVCMYIMQRIKLSLEGNRVGIHLDEGWLFLDDPYWKVQLKKDLPTFRKLNAYLIFATQSPDSVVKSSLSAQLLDNCPTNIFFCNPKANFEKHYSHFNVTSGEFDFIKETPQEARLFLYKQAQDSAICKLNLSGMEDELAVYSANKAMVNLLDKIRADVGNKPQEWMPVYQERRRLVDAD